MTQLSLFDEKNDLTEIEQISSDMSSCRTMEELSDCFQTIIGIKDQLYFNFSPQSSQYYRTFLTVFEDNTAFISNIENRPFPEITCFDFYDRTKGYRLDPEYTRDLLYCDQNGQVWKSTLNIRFENEVNSINQTMNYIRFQAAAGHVKKWSFSPWKKFNKFPVYDKTIILNSDKELWDILERTRPYTAEWMKSVNYSKSMTLLCCPQLEQLYKAGYAFAEDIIRRQYLDRTYTTGWRAHRNGLEEDVHYFNMLCKPGTKPKDIFQTEKPVYSALKNEESLKTWNRFRLMYKQGKIKSDTVDQVYHAGFDENMLRQISGILNHTYEGKPVFTWNSLLNYLQRLDMYEAIPAEEALPLLLDVLRMSNQLMVKPNITGDSLKREHDVLARTCRQKQDDILAAKMEDACKKLEKYDYSENIYFIRGIKSYADLLDEARQQHNCVASYAHDIINGRSLIYVMREKDKPEKSLITIELTPKTTEIRQKYLAFNQPIRNKSQSEFIDRWLNCVRQCRKEKADSIQSIIDKGYSPSKQNPALQDDGTYLYCSIIPIDMQNYIACNSYPDDIKRFTSPKNANGKSFYGTVTFRNALSKDKMEKLNLVPLKNELSIDTPKTIFHW